MNIITAEEVKTLLNKKDITLEGDGIDFSGLGLDHDGIHHYNVGSGKILSNNIISMERAIELLEEIYC